ncbi:hypothetical protein Ciccas_006246 [Cichlidogyrus casuarinus]|uniref:Uncharacterized protein n=1 Tax=Cichlidogyrus casuarinus TaxID=1844966 RepID=A0ABD2Q6A7_9PLAT
MNITDEQVTTIILLAVTVAFIVALTIPEWTCGNVIGNQNLYECAKHDYKNGGGIQMTAFALLVTAAVTAAIGALRGLSLMFKGSMDKGRPCTFLKWIVLAAGSACGVVAIVMFASRSHNFSLLIATAATAVLCAQAVRVLLAETCG